jgi:hypothetical protein
MALCVEGQVQSMRNKVYFDTTFYSSDAVGQKVTSPFTRSGLR